MRALNALARAVAWPFLWLAALPLLCAIEKHNRENGR